MHITSTDPEEVKKVSVYIPNVARMAWKAAAANAGVSVSFMIAELAKALPEYEQQLERMTSNRPPEAVVEKIAEAVAK